MSSKAEIASGSVNVTVDVLKATSKEAAVVVDALAPFLPLISEVGAIVAEIIDLYQTAEHNKRICGSLLSRVTTAENAVNILKIRRLENEDLFKSKQYYKDFQKLVNVIKKIQKFIADVSQLNGLRKFLLAHSIEDGFKRLTDEFDGLMRVLNFSLAIQTQIQVEDDNKALRKDIEEMTNARGIADKLSQINDKLDDISQLNILWQKQLLNSDEDELRSAKIPFTELHDPPQPVRRGKVIKKVRLGEDVAIKAKPVSKEDDKKDILGQVIILKKLKESQFICQFYGVSQDGDIMYLVTEWCEFGNLTEYHKLNGPLNWHYKSQLAVDIARGLTFLHAVSILHHDIRSENILITNHCQAKIANFTLSRGFDDATKNITPTIDNVRWMAPEKLKNKNSPYTAKCEIYSFGMLLWEIAEEKIPFQNEMDILKIVNNVIDKIRPSFSLGVPIEWSKLVYQVALQDSPTARPPLKDISPWSNEYDPYINDGILPSSKIRKLEIAANEAFNTYREMYYEVGDGVRKMKGVWDSIHVFKANERSRKAQYKLTSTVMLYTITNKPDLGNMNLSGSMTRQFEAEYPFDDPSAHIVNIGRMVEDIELKMRNLLQEVYFSKTKDIVNGLRSVNSLVDAQKQMNVQKELVGKLLERKA
ncbi:2137_t:CDS:2 [Entrophospora sp. SA101]|nr:2137_t:CDS:2 [Entrophospora sp. SA101]